MHEYPYASEIDALKYLASKELINGYALLDDNPCSERLAP